MYLAAIDSPVANLEYLRAGGGASTYREQAIVAAKVKAADALLQQYAKEKASEMLINLDVKKAARNIDAQQVNWTSQVITGILVIGGVLLLTKQLSK